MSTFTIIARAATQLASASRSTSLLHIRDSIWDVTYSTSTPQVVQSCTSLDQFTWAISLLPTRIAITATFAIRVYAVMERGLLFVVILSFVGLLVVALDIILTDIIVAATVLTFFSLSCFDVLATALITFRLLRVIKLNGGFKVLDPSSTAGLVASSGNCSTFRVILLLTGLSCFCQVQYTFCSLSTVTACQLVAIVLYFLPQGVYSTVLNNYMILLSSVLVSRFLLDLRDVAEKPEETVLVSMKFVAAPRKHSTITLIRDFEDPVEMQPCALETYNMAPVAIGGRESGDQLASAFCPLEDLVDRARQLEVVLAATGPHPEP
ncbi:hypothetical protein BV22DRAFT_1045932 [Leucogyrophana mollusca]|uniref:Uncharacterized protein n=1 Tax=Leucogyrophana mollusca TaxID=85980 RepID=A0ACB8BQ29_9AGAM|nr:hypothetical protein BV22DRAFT_1045932 [Leucogyrophana mollusca]